VNSVPWTWLLQSAAVINAVLLALVLCMDRRPKRTLGQFKLAGVLLTFAAALALFTAMDAGWIAVSAVAIGSEYVCGLLAGALLVDFTAAAVRSRFPARTIYLVPAVYALALFPLGSALLGEGLLLATIGIQLILSALATWLYRSARHGAPRHLAALIFGVWALHAVQLARIAFPQTAWLFDAVPVIAAALMMALTALVITDSRSLRAIVREATPPTAGPDLLAIVDQMQANQAFSDREFDLQRLADSLGLSTRRLSTMLAQHGTSFYELLHAQRVAAAKQLLRDPSERRTSVEAVGLMIGYRSRSTFYESFRKATGQSPAEYRRSAG